MKRKQRAFPVIKYTQITSPFSPGTSRHSSVSQGLWGTWSRFLGVFHLRSSTAKDLVLSARHLPDSLPSLGHRFEQHESCCDLCHLAVAPKSLFTLDVFSLDYNYTTETTWVGKLCTCVAGVIQVQNFVTSNTSVLMLSVKPFTPDKPLQQAVHQLWVASMCITCFSFVPLLLVLAGCKRSWLPQSGSEQLCNVHNLPITPRTIWQRGVWGGYSRFVLLPSAKWSHVPFFLQESCLVQGSILQGVEPHCAGLSALALPRANGHGEHPSSFRNVQHISEMANTFQYWIWQKWHQSRLMFCIWTRLCFWRTWGSSLCWIWACSCFDWSE